MIRGIPVLTEKGRKALAARSQDLSLKCRHVLIQVDGKRSLDEIRKTLGRLGGIDEAIEKLSAGDYIEVSSDCRDAVKALAEKILGAKAPVILKKIDELYARHGNDCWKHIDEIDKTARLFYGKVLADELDRAIKELLAKTEQT